MTVVDDAGVPVPGARIDVERLERVWRGVELRALEAAAQMGLTLEETLRRTHLDGWYQADYRVPSSGTECGTAMCVAGWIAHDDVEHSDDTGWVVPNADVPWYSGRQSLLWARPDEAGAEAGHWYGIDPEASDPPERMVVNASQRAINLLGLFTNESSRLFAGSNSLARVQELISELRTAELLRRAVVAHEARVSGGEATGS